MDAQLRREETLPDTRDSVTGSARGTDGTVAYRRHPCPPPCRVESSANWPDPASVVPSKQLDSAAHGTAMKEESRKRG